jgi:predicted membrane protein (TIGR00267 family)
MDEPGSNGPPKDLKDELTQIEQSQAGSQTSIQNAGVNQEKPLDLLNERKRVERLSRIRQIVFGSLDGLLVPLGVVSGVAGGTSSTKAVIVAGLAEAFAGALSMGAGEFIAGKSESQVQKAEIQKELEEMRLFPEYELKEMTELLKQTGVTSEDAPVIAHYLQRNPRLYAKTMVAEELGLNLEVEDTKVVNAITMGLSYIVASIVPLIAYFFVPIETAFYISLGLSFLFLVGLGLLKGMLTKMNLVSSALSIVIVGTVSGLGGYLLGVWLPKLFGY